MAVSLKFICLLGLLVVVNVAMLERVDAAGECGKTSPEDEAIKFTPCKMAAQDEKAAVSDSCCAQVNRLSQNPACLCAIMLSDTAKASEVKPQAAMSVPKRCNIANRPVGYKCAGYTLP